MPISGLLQELSLTDLVQIIAAGQRSGKLRLSSRDGDGLILFRKGKIIYIASSSIRETLGSLLVSKGLVTQSDLDNALTIQHQSETEIRLGTVLIETGVVSQETIREVIAGQTLKAFSEFLAWTEGHFTYQRQEFPDLGEIAVDAVNFISEEGLRTDQMLLEIANKLDELRDQQDGTRESFATVTPVPSTGESKAPKDADKIESSFASLKSSVEEIRSPHFTGEISGEITGFAQKLFERWVLFMVARNGFRVTAEFTRLRALPEAQERQSDLLVPVEAPSILSEVLSRKETIIGPLTTTDWNVRILDFVESSPTETSVVVPLTVNGQVLAILYATRLRRDASPRWPEELELLMMQIGLTVERDLFERQVEHFEGLRAQA